jgi:pyruvate,water dikinase
MKDFLKRFIRRWAHEAEKKHTRSDSPKDKYPYFQNLLRENNRVLSIMADMEEKLSGEYLFDKQYIRTNTTSIADAVLDIIKNLDNLSAGRFKLLYERYGVIKAAVEESLSPQKIIPISDLTITIKDLKREMSDIAGGKIAHLGEIVNQLNLPVPDGFSITAYASKLFLEHNKLTEKITEMLKEMNINDLGHIQAMSKQIQDMVIDAEIPAEMMRAIQHATENLRSENRPLTVSVRSSAILEDGEFSFAGQYATFLNVTEELIPRRYKEVIASLFTPRAIFYYKTKGLSEEELVMAVGVLRMLHARSAGVIYTRDPNEPDREEMIINAVRGLGKAVVDGMLEPDYYTISKQTGAITGKRITQQRVMLVCDQDGDIKELPVPEEMIGTPCLSDEQVQALTAYASALERYYGKPQDIEWAIDADDTIYILQSRALAMASTEQEEITIPRRIEGHTVLLDKGIIASKGVGHGKAFVLKKEADLKDFPQGAVLVARQTSTKYVTIMSRASAIITDIGGATGHMASLSREYGVPTILDTEKATTTILDGQEITVDAFNCNVYEGRVDQLLEYWSRKKDSFKGTHLFKTLDRTLKWIVPLNLVDPEDRGFQPANCRTFHDITRFSHEKAMAVMFQVGEGRDTEGGTIALGKEGPLDAHFIDMDGCVREGVKIASPEDIYSKPFSAFLKGLLSLPWPEPRAADVRGFLGMMMQGATVSEAEMYQTGRQSFALIASQYMNFSIRLGYHFSMVEAYAGENRNDNYIKYFFKGGGAAVDRRLRRLKVISEILGRLDFKVTITEDVINASLMKYSDTDIEKRLAVLGKLTVYTRQLDLIMYNDALIDQRIKEFIQEHIHREA